MEKYIFLIPCVLCLIHWVRMILRLRRLQAQQVSLTAQVVGCSRREAAGEYPKLSPALFPWRLELTYQQEGKPCRGIAVDCQERQPGEELSVTLVSGGILPSGLVGDTFKSGAKHLWLVLGLLFGGAAAYFFLHPERSILSFSLTELFKGAVLLLVGIMLLLLALAPLLAFLSSLVGLFTTRRYQGRVVQVAEQKALGGGAAYYNYVYTYIDGEGVPRMVRDPDKITSPPADVVGREFPLYISKQSGRICSPAFGRSLPASLVGSLVLSVLWYGLLYYLGVFGMLLGYLL